MTMARQLVRTEMTLDMAHPARMASTMAAGMPVVAMRVEAMPVEVRL